MDINQLVGKRLAQVVGRGNVAKFCKDAAPYLGEEWDPQTYYDATNGRRYFRVSELVGLARAAGVSVYELVDPRPLGVAEVTIKRKDKTRSKRWKVTISADELVDQFKAPGEAQGPMWRALHENRAILGELPALLAASREIEKELRIFYPQLPAFQEDPT